MRFSDEMTLLFVGRVDFLLAKVEVPPLPCLFE